MSLLGYVIPPWVKFAVAGVVLAVILGWTAHTSYTYGYNKRDVAAKAEIIAQQNADMKARDALDAQKKQLQDKYDSLAAELQTTQNQLAEEKKNVKTKIVKEIQSNPVYQSCTMPPSGVQIIRDQAQQLNSIRSGK
jgi:uncharacterized protein involved in exopolysaccharide biosynthesis